MDLSIFKANYSNPICNSSSFKTCPAIIRLLSALNYYSSLSVNTNSDDQQIFLHFMDQVYSTQILDDYHHLTKHHQQNDQLLGIAKYAIDQGPSKACNIDECSFSTRHYRNREKETVHYKSPIDVDSKLNFYIETMDSLHFYIFHLYDVSLRFTDDKNEETQDENMSMDNNDYFDQEFSRKCKISSSTRNASARFDRINDNSSKFNINADNNNEPNINSENDEQGFTYLDAVFNHLSSVKEIENGHINRLYVYLQEEDYCTESVGDDLLINNGNICQFMSNKTCFDALSAIFQKSQCM